MENQDTRFEEIEDIEETEETEEETPQHSGIGIFGAMAIGSGLTLGGIALFKKLKKVLAAKKTVTEAEAETPEAIIEVEVVDDTNAQPEAKDKQPKK